ncbi:MAG TPA: methylated-DNA--[protein]-cysteine S-methyltransferase [Usitatibacteraceae bacterium]|nr:methylated-DNA--[protein]-cysteine S-methyltransferase [Usitatibacteraceae bacterium]
MDEKLAFDACVRTPFATLGIVTSSTHLTGLHFLPASVAAKAPRPNSIAHLVCAQLTNYLENPNYAFDLPLKLAGTKHQLDVWSAMRAIRPGSTRSYGELASAIGSSPRAVGSACGHNPVPIIVPCHRVIAADGGLGGFMGGKLHNPLAIKQWLLRHEGALLV